MSRKVKEHILSTIRSFHDIAGEDAESDLMLRFQMLRFQTFKFGKVVHMY